MFVNVGGDIRDFWINVDQIVSIEPAMPSRDGWTGKPSEPPSKVAWVVTLSNGTTRGVTDEDLTKIKNVSDAKH